MNAKVTLINVSHCFKHGVHVFTSADVKGLYVASKDAKNAFDGVAPSLHTLLADKLSERYKPEDITVEAITTFDEFLEWLRADGIIEPTIEDRSFAMKIAA